MQIKSQEEIFVVLISMELKENELCYNHLLYINLTRWTKYV